jgi:hypothetical protein
VEGDDKACYFYNAEPSARDAAGTEKLSSIPNYLSIIVLIKKLVLI